MPINLYNNRYYTSHNVWGVLRFYKDDLSTIQKYIAKIATSSNVYRLIYDTVSLSIGTKVRYSISQENWNALLSATDVDVLLAQAPPHTESEAFVLDVYRKYKEYPSADPIADKGGIVVPAQLRIEF